MASATDAAAMKTATPRARFSPCGALGLGEIAGELGLGVIGTALSDADGVALCDSEAAGVLVGVAVGVGVAADGDAVGVAVGEGTTALGLGETQFGSTVKRTVRCST